MLCLNGELIRNSGVSLVTFAQKGKDVIGVIIKEVMNTMDMTRKSDNINGIKVTHLWKETMNVGDKEYITIT